LDENEPPWEVLVQKSKESRNKEAKSEHEDEDSNEYNTTSDWEASETGSGSNSFVRACAQAAAAWSQMVCIRIGHYSRVVY